MNYDLLREMLKRHEGLRFKPYLCPAKKLTIGVGWNLDAHALPPDMAHYFRLKGEISEPMADQLLNISIDMAERQCEGICPMYQTPAVTAKPLVPASLNADPEAHAKPYRLTSLLWMRRNSL